MFALLNAGRNTAVVQSHITEARVDDGSGGGRGLVVSGCSEWRRRAESDVVERSQPPCCVDTTQTHHKVQPSPNPADTQKNARR